MPHPESRRPGEPLTLDDLEIAKKLDPKVRVDGKWHQKKIKKRSAIWNGNKKLGGGFQ